MSMKYKCFSVYIDKVGTYRTLAVFCYQSQISLYMHPCTQDIRIFLLKMSLNDHFSFCFILIHDLENMKFPELQVREGNEDNSKIIFLISQRKHMLLLLRNMGNYP